MASASKPYMYVPILIYDDHVSAVKNLFKKLIENKICMSILYFVFFYRHKEQKTLDNLAKGGPGSTVKMCPL